MIKIGIAGAAGKMGGRIAALAGDYDGLSLAGAFEKKGHKNAGKDIGLLLGRGETGVRLAEGIDGIIDSVDLVIDFTTVESTKENLRAVAAKNKAMVIGTTGFTKEDLRDMEPFTGRVPCVMASNMSLGVNLLLKVLMDVASALGDDYDVEIVEAHHRMKKDAPSGTALKMAQVVADALGRNLDEAGVYARHGLIGARTRKEIGIQSLRGGDIVGEHTVMFAGLGERIEITHKASSRDTFARGALKAALWVADKSAGLYDMQDVLGLK